MTDQRIEGAANGLTGRVQEGFGRLTGDSKSQIDGAFKQVKGTAQDYYGRAVNGLESQIDRVPETMRPQARQAIQFTRDRPLVTVLGLAAGLLLLTRGTRRR